MTQRRPQQAQALSTNPARRLRWLAVSALVIAGMWFSSQALAQSADIFKGADLKLGEQLIAQN